jgi:RNA polymerase sigma-70 factor (ECF subfamily)
MVVRTPLDGADFVAAQLLGEREALLRYVVTLLAPDLRHAEDVVQETLLRAWLHADRLDWQARPIRPWLLRTARNLAVDTWRKDRAIPVGSAADVTAGSPGTDDAAGQVADRHWLLPALRRLPRAQYEILAYLYLLDLGGEQAAALLGIPRGTVKSRAHYAVRSLRRELGAGEDGHVQGNDVSDGEKAAA